jgi:putative ABC transport system permease protein
VLVRGALDQPGWDTVAALLADQAPGRAVHRLEAARSTVEAQRDLAVTQPGCTGSVDACSWSPGAQFQLTTISGAVVVADADTVRALTSGPVAADITQVLAQGRVAVLGAGALDSQGDVRLTGFGYDPSGTATVLGQASLPATEIALPRDQTVTVPGFVVVPPALAGRLPIPVSTSQLLAGGPGDPVTPAQQERVQERVTALSPSASVYVERGWTDTSAVARAVLFTLGAFLVLIAVFTATGLTLTDARPDFATLAAIGAAPGVRRRMAMGSAAVIGISGAVLGVLVGLAPGIAVAHPLTDASYGAGNSGAVVVIPWTTLAGVAIAVPLLAVAVTGLAVRSRLPMTRRTT